MLFWFECDFVFCANDLVDIGDYAVVTTFHGDHSHEIPAPSLLSSGALGAWWGPVTTIHNLCGFILDHYEHNFYHLGMLYVDDDA